MAEIKPYAIQAAQAYNSIAGHDKVEPQMLVWWAVYDTGGRINYNNCNDLGTPKGYNYYNWNTNCNNTWLWQLGYGAQFSHVKIMKEGFQKLYGDPNNAKVVQEVGQAILDFDETIPTAPPCGNYGCTFPSMSIDQILSGVVINKQGSPLNNPLPEDNWWASVLLRDPLLNAYNMADILTVDIINKNAVCSWRGNYCTAWGAGMTNSLSQVVKMWDSIPSKGIYLVGNPKQGAVTTGKDLASQFYQPGGQYYDYYAFAKKFLFDGKDLFTISGGSPTGVVSCNNPLLISDPAATKDLIYKTYGFRVSVDKGLNEEDQLAQTYNTLCLLFQSSTFAKLLQTMNPDGTVADAMTLLIHNQSPSAYQNHCGTGNDFNSNQPEIYACANPVANRFVLIHELGHTVYARNDSLATNYSNIFESNHNQRFLPTDNCQLSGTKGFGSNPNHECFADMVGEYVVFNTYKHSATNRNARVTFSEFPTNSNYKFWYDWAATNIFGGTSYANQSSNNMVEYAKKLKDQIVQACPPAHYDHGWEIGAYVYVNQKNQQCLTNMSSSTLGSHYQNVLRELFQSIKDFYYLQCVGFARAVAQGVGAPIGPDDRASSTYYNWIPVTRGVNDVPGGVLPGDIALFSLHECANPKLSYNKCPRLERFITPHIGIVTDVGPTGFDLAEANGGNGTVDITKGYNYHYDTNFDGVLRLKKALQ